ncbi:TonB-dependent receptor [Arenimonas sp.]|uniref:TonB-dependent receptor domain-containing protein n=1 Tax=Arenimonas sp. TaxID=1872635 RepID=UPI0025FF5936|nr:TonB-dependent receptor [Arenimonas sp.]
MTLIPIYLALAAVGASAGTEGDTLRTLDAVVVVGSRSAEPLRQVVGAVSRVDREAMDRRGVQGIEDLARLLPGMDVASDANRFGAQGFNLRGLEGNRVGVELDGVPLPDGFGVGQFALAGRDLVELGLVERLEVLRGPASTLHGSKALAGVVAYWTPDPAEAAWDEGERVMGQGRLGFGTRDDARWLSGRLLARGADERLAMLVALGRRQGHETENSADDPGSAANPADYRSDSALLRVGFDAGAAGRWSAIVERAEGRRETDVQSQLFGPGRFATTYALFGDDRYERTRASLGAQWDTVGPLGPVRLLAWRQDSRTDQSSEQYRLPDRATPFESLRERRFLFEQESAGLELNAQWRGTLAGAEHWQVFGIDLARHDYVGFRDGLETNLASGASSNVILGEILPLRDFPNTRVDEIGLFWQDEIRFGEGWALVPGLRWERYRLDARPDALWREDNPGLAPVSLDSEQFTPKLGLRWNRGALGLYAQYARGFRAPPFSDVNIGLNLPAFNYVALPNPDLQPERSQGLELGLRWDGEFLKGTLALYDNRYRDLIESRANLGRNDDGQLVFQSVNRDRARIRGVELEGRWWLASLSERAEGWYLDGVASWSRGDDTSRDLPLNTVPPARASLAVGFEAADGRWGGELRLGGVRAVTRADQSAGALFLPPGYSQWDLHAWASLGEHLRLNLSVFNLADHRAWDWSALRGLPATADDVDFYSRPGRGARLGLVFDF